MLNHITIMGRLTRDPELRRTGSGTPVASFTVAVERDYAQQGQEKKTDFFDCVAWDKKGEFVAQYFPKGSMIIVTGRMEFRDWTDRDGNKRRSAEIKVADIYFGGSKGGSDSRQGAQKAPESVAGGGEYTNPYYAAIMDGKYNGGSSGAPVTPAGDPNEFAMLGDGDEDAMLPF